MKKTYSMPILSVDVFTPNQAIAACKITNGITWTFDCMAGGQTDTASNVVSTDIDGATCGTNIGYAGGSTTARDYSHSTGHSNYAGGTWTTVSGGKGSSGYLQVIYKGAAGLLYADSDSGSMTTDNWDVTDGIVKHSSNQGLTHHMVAPLTSTQVQNMSKS